MEIVLHVSNGMPRPFQMARLVRNERCRGDKIIARNKERPTRDLRPPLSLRRIFYCIGKERHSGSSLEIPTTGKSVFLHSSKKYHKTTSL